MASEDSYLVAAPPSMKRIPKACSACRQSKVKCDGKRPCTRCEKLKKQCVFFEIPKDPVTERLESVESEVQRLQAQLADMRQMLRGNSQPQNDTDTHVLAGIEPFSQLQPTDPDPAQQCRGSVSLISPRQISAAASVPGLMPPAEPNFSSARGQIPVQSRVRRAQAHGDVFRASKKRRSGFEVREEPIADFVSLGMITLEYAVDCFTTFFQGCDRYIPIFDPRYDTFESVRYRSSILLNAICTIGSRVEARAGSQLSDLLQTELKKWINVVIQNETLNCLESVQALLVIACYSAERSLILSFATRMALDLGLDEAFEELTQHLTMKDFDGGSGVSSLVDDENALMRKSRTWFGLLVLEHIFSLDGGKPPGIRMTGNSRRCRKLLDHPSSTVLDLRLFSQVELNVIRVHINETLGTKAPLARADVAAFVQEAKLDLDLWFDDWQRIIENALAPEDEERGPLLAALRVQKCWGEMMLHCKALRSMGVENVAAMSNVERKILLMAKASARKHLSLITIEPDSYLAKLKYAMDFVWAKCAFCFLLLLKLSRLLPEGKEEHEELLNHGNRLLDDLTKSVSSSNIASNSNVYLQILRLSIEKYGRTLHESGLGTDGGATEDTAPFWELFDAQTELTSFVPEQFVSEWDFPGLNLFYFPTTWQDFFADFSLAV
ncbi:Putative C6 zinc finger domain protein [Aspergillus calidoustus]|uniref:Putative C6 zinc finger domain protein n=1 Tax=Aspergillus calidoustus TaxID=454130 RepID=A0A0U5GAV8_ASPCI|nr:Putative C6 zinc finger domain protein [Aspergillus calidoustus]